MAIHRKHHAKCESAEDPHSPRTYGIHRVLWAGVFLYVKEFLNKETLERYGHGTPDDWIERALYSRRFSYVGVASLLGIYAFALASPRWRNFAAPSLVRLISARGERRRGGCASGTSARQVRREPRGSVFSSLPPFLSVLGGARYAPALPGSGNSARLAA